MISLAIAAASGFLTVLSFICGYSTFKIANANRAAYDSNKNVTVDFKSAAMGSIADVECTRVGYPVDHYAVPFLNEKGEVIKWEVAGSLSNEAIDGVLVRPS
jgi:hypothetical protein